MAINYNFLHARNELAHNNRMMMQASGTFCILITYNDQAMLEDLLSFTQIIESQNSVSINVLLLEKANAEVVHYHLLENDPEQINVLFLCLKVDGQLDENELFIGQEVDFKLENETLQGVTDESLHFSLSTSEGKRLWEAWILDNIASHDIEYYEPGMD